MENYVVPVDMREKRRANRLTQEDVAQRLHITRIHANRIENGTRPLTIDIALDLVDLFGSLTVERAHKRYVITSGNGAPEDHPRPHRDPFAALNDTERIVRLSKELGDVQACTSELPRCLLNPQARRDFIRRLLKEGLEADMVLEAVIASADPALLAEAAAMTEAEIAAECGEVA